MQFQIDKKKDTLALLDFEKKVNAMTSAYTAQLDFKVRKTNIGTQKIDKSSLETYAIVIATFKVLHHLGHSWFFQESFLLTDISLKVILGMLFLIFNNVDV